ncbi:hypothetical protein Clacol_002504 [Clathrus columnatus]|uniref:DUF1295-domain-containing protein n=1 Tax=Clathrus columnatus TaxID=1419009 RepID=A0AAV5A6N0_9AGAM|nr:hypothetical protein Clacol_002504 [Clathrus columnatus]
MQHISPEFSVPIKFCLFNIAWTWIASVITRNVSQVDRVWTFLPTIYTAYYAIYPLLPFADPGIKSLGVSPRAGLMLLLQILWMVRLSYNTWRRGLFSLKDEDYRWEICRKQVPGWAFQIFNFFFIAVAQNILLFILGLPAHNALIRQPTTLGATDIILAELALVVLALEFTADNQQWSFQIKGVINPNEWFGACISWTEDDRQRESISGKKYPDYAAYQERVGMFWPFGTIVKGHLLNSKGKKAEIDRKVWGPVKGKRIE